MTDVRGSVTTRQQLREWNVEVAPLSEVNLLNLGNPAVSWMRIASGSNQVVNGLLAKFDPTGTRVLLAGRDGMLTIAPFDAELARADLRARLRDATSYCYSHERRRVDLRVRPR